MRTPRTTAARGAVLAGSVALVVVVLGCSHRTYITKADFLRQGDVICGQVNRSLEAQRATLSPTDIGQHEQFIRIVANDDLAAIVKVRALGYPKGDQGRLDVWFGSFQNALRAVASHPATLAGVDSTALTAATHGLKTYGFNQCGLTALANG